MLISIAVYRCLRNHRHMKFSCFHSQHFDDVCGGIVDVICNAFKHWLKPKIADNFPFSIVYMLMVIGFY